jgi:N-acetylglucosaminyl-diphospho-decaprenol L-rhamnosyltransferase
VTAPSPAVRLACPAMSTPHEPAALVVCVVYHPGDELETFASSLAGASNRPVELVVVDNGDDHAVARSVTERHGARLVVPGANLGYGRAANLGAEQASTPWIVVANSDIVWEPGSLDVLLDAGEAHPAAGSLGPALLNVDGTLYPSARALPSLVDGAGHALFTRVWPGNPWTRRYQAGNAPSHARRAAGWLSGACLLLRRAAFEQVGGFDDGYFMFFEDVDLGDRLGRAGWTNLYVPDARATHVGGTSWRDRPAPMISAHHASAARYVARRYPHWYQAPVRWAVTRGLRLRERSELRAAS